MALKICDQKLYSITHIFLSLVWDFIGGRTDSVSEFEKFLYDHIEDLESEKFFSKEECQNFLTIDYSLENKRELRILILSIIENIKIECECSKLRDNFSFESQNFSYAYEESHDDQKIDEIMSDMFSDNKESIVCNYDEIIQITKPGAAYYQICKEKNKEIDYFFAVKIFRCRKCFLIWLLFLPGFESHAHVFVQSTEDEINRYLKIKDIFSS